jgi:hypothetical protein
VAEGTGAAVSDEKTDPKPPKDSAEAALQARAIRGRIDQDLRALESRLPPPDTLQAQVKTYGGAAAAGIAGLGAAFLALRRRSAAKAEEQHARRQAEALAKALPDAALQIRQEHVSSKAGRIGLLVALAALGVALWTRFGSSGGQEDLWGTED